jgi:hypothetical protein
MKIAYRLLLVATAASLGACSSVETLTANCRARLAAAPVVAASSDGAKVDDQPPGPAEGEVTICVKQSAQAEAQARAVVGTIALVVLTAGAVALAAGGGSRTTYRHRPVRSFRR